MSVLIIAEAGVNHNGSVDTACRLIDAAAKAGADAVKFQTFTAQNLLVKNTPKADYQKHTTTSDESQFAMLEKLQLDRAAHQQLIAHCAQQGVMFLSSPFDHASIDLLASFDVPLFKIPSGEITNVPYLRRLGALKKRFILSTGMSTLEEIKAALQCLTNAGASPEKITLLHANTMYPTPMEDVNLRAMQTMAKVFDLPVGYSDHTVGIEVAIAAVALGACVIEKHFTLDRALPGPDHQASLVPDELCAMVKAIRHIESALGSRDKQPSPSERVNMAVARKSIVARCPIAKGELLGEHNLCVKRPGSGMSPLKWDTLMGTPATQDYQVDDLL